MASGAYSFIDVAVLAPIRERMAAGMALVVLDERLDEILWANGAGALMLGHEDIAEALGSGSGLSALAQRQVAGSLGRKPLGDLATVAIRLPGALSARITMIETGRIALPNGETGVLMVLAPGPEAAEDAHARALDGFAQSGFYAALVNDEGALLAASPGFEALGISGPALEQLSRQVAEDDDRLVKRPIEGRRGMLPAGIARLRDAPALNLVLAIDEPMDQPEPRAARPPEPVQPEPEPRIEPKAPVAEVPEPAAPQPTAEIAASEAQDPSPPAPIEAEEAALAPERIMRFVWRTDEQGRIVSFSDSFTEAVGEAATQITGLTFPEFAARLGMDEPVEIARLIERRDTWSGRSMLWPIAGTAMRVPVDLAALPIYSRDRTFQGFRGFGVVRLDRQVEAAHGIGVAPAPEAEPAAETEAPAPDTIEPPALAITETPERRETDKVIRLAERRAAAQEAGPAGPLSPVERLAFREIGARLRAAGIDVADPAVAPEAEPQDEPAPASEGLAGASDVSAEREEPRPTDEIVPPADVSEILAAAPVPQEPDAEVSVVEDSQPVWGRGLADETLVGGLPIPALVHAGDTLHFANRAFLDLTGHDDLASLVAAGGIDGIFAEGEVEDGRMLVRDTAGETHAVSARLQSIGWAGGTALLMTLVPELATVEDEDDGVVEDLEARLAELRTIVDTATDGIVVIAPNGTIRSISRAAEALFGLDSKTVEGDPFTNLFVTESRRAAADYLAGLSGNGVASLLNDGREVIGREAQGRFIPLFMTIGRLPSDGGYCAVLRDITHWKRAEEELTQARARAEKASSQKTDFLAHVSHEIRTPLNAIIGFSELMLDEKFGPIGNERYRGYLRDINRSGNHVLDLVNDLLDISKIEAGEQEMAYEAVSLNDTLAETVAMMQPQANRERVIIRSSFASRLPDVVADRRSIRQIALNLLSNAVRHTPAGGQVIVSTGYEAGGEVLIRFRDTGSGMTLGEIEQAMKPFKQLNTMKRQRGDGTGLGLPLTKALVEANRAKFAISSTPSEGTLVEITFPSTRVLAD
jgi:PAS domain S-box-containing protein